MRRLEISSAVLALLLLSGAAGAAAQEPPAFRDAVEVRVISVEVFVEDRDGNPVHGLEADDFVILENGRPQQITNFSEYRSGRNSDRTVGPGAGRPDGVDAGVVGADEPRQPRTVVFFVDAFHQSPRDRAGLFSRIRAFLREGLASGDRAALLTWRGRATEVVPLTTELRRVDEGLAVLAGLQLPEADSGLDALREFFEESAAFAAAAGLEGGESVDQQMAFVTRNCAEDHLNEMEAKTASLRRLMQSLAGVEGRKVLVYVAGRFPANTQVYCAATERGGGPAIPSGLFSTDELVDAVTDAANAAGVTLYPIRPTLERRSTSAEHAHAAAELGAPGSFAGGDQMLAFTDADALATLAEKTGGELAVGDGMVGPITSRIIADLDDYYSIGYRASSDGSDRKRRIEVRTRDRGMRVRSRSSFVEKSRLTEVREQLVAHLLGASAAGEIILDLAEGEPREARRGRSVLPVEVRIPLDQLVYAGADRTSQIRLLSVAGDGAGSVSEISEVTRQIEQPPSDAPSPFAIWEVDVTLDRDGGRAAFGVLDEMSGLAGFVTVDRTSESLARRERERLEDLARWRVELIRRQRAGKPIVVYFRPEPCLRRDGFDAVEICDRFETEVLADGAIADRLEKFELVRWVPDGVAADWPVGRAGLAVVRVDGTPIARWSDLPEAAELAQSLDLLSDQAGALVGIDALVRQGHTEHADLAAAMVQIRLGLRRDAAASLERLVATANEPVVREMAAVRLAFLAAGSSRESGLSRLRELARESSEPVAQAEAWLAVASLLTGAARIAALERALAVAPQDSQQFAIARSEIDRLTDG